MSSAPVTSSPAQTLPRVLGLFDSVMIVVGSIIGSGIFLNASRVATAIPGTGLILAVWIGVGLITLCGALALAELAAMLPQAGGPYVYLREAYGKLPAFLWGWSEFWIVRTASLGALSAATALYLNVLLRQTLGSDLSHVSQGLTAAALVIVLSAVNILSTRWGAHVQNVTGVVKIAFLVALIGLPFLLGRTDWANLQPVWPVAETAGSIGRGLGVAIIAVMWPYDGWINLAPVAEEVRNPQRNVPRALALGMFIVIAVYVSVTAVYHLVLPMADVCARQEIAATIWSLLLSRSGAGIAAVGVMCSTFGAVNSNMLTGPRIYFAMARDRLLPDFLRKIHTRYHTPAAAVAVQGVWTVLLIFVAYAWKENPIEAFDVLTDFAIFGGLPFYALSVGAVYVLRKKYPDLPRPYLTWGYPVTPALYLLMFTAVMLAMFIGQWKLATAGTSLIFCGLGYYGWRQRSQRFSPPPGS